MTAPTYESHELMACVDCGFEIANGYVENPDPRWNPEGIYARWPAAEGWHLHNGDSDNDEEFSTRPCECCGSTLAGARMEVIAMRRTDLTNPTPETP